MSNGKLDAAIGHDGVAVERSVAERIGDSEEGERVGPNPGSSNRCEAVHAIDDRPIWKQLRGGRQGLLNGLLHLIGGDLRENQFKELV